MAARLATLGRFPGGEGRRGVGLIHTAVGEAQDTDDDEIKGHDVIEQARHDQDEDAGDQCHQGLYGEKHVHERLPRVDRRHGGSFDALLPSPWRKGGQWRRWPIRARLVSEKPFSAGNHLDPET